jgi:hypothetical protein
MSDRPSFLLDLRLADLSGWWLQMQCCRGMTCMPCRLLATGLPAGFTLGGTLRSLRCRQCRRRPAQVILTANPADRAQGRAGSPNGWRIEVTLPDPGYPGWP